MSLVADGSFPPVGLSLTGAFDAGVLNTLVTFDVNLSSTVNSLNGHYLEWFTGPNVPAGAYFTIDVEYFGISGVEDRTGGLAQDTNSVVRTGRVELGAASILTGVAAPTTLTWKVGDRVFNAAPAVGQPKSWVCTVAGTPGTWVSEGNL